MSKKNENEKIDVKFFFKGNVSIPQRLSSPIRPTHTPIRQAIRLQNGTLSTVHFDQTGTTSASGSSEGSSTSSSFNNSLYGSKIGSSATEAQRYSNPNYHDFADSSSSQIASLAQLKVGNEKGSFLLANNSNQAGAKQHSLSDDHLHLYAQRETNVS